MIKAWIKIEVQCEDCNGEGEIYIGEEQLVTCSSCDGDGHLEQKITLNDLKGFLEGSD
jgi:DnaJ-class molecular chaperone